MSERQLRDEAMTLFVAGQETTAAALAWCWYLLAQNPAEQDRVREEARDVIGRNAPSAQDLPRLIHARAAAEETMRLYPPAWAVDRTAMRDVELGGYCVPKGTMVVAAQWVTHRDPALWKASETFCPARFVGRRVDLKDGYFPFGAGPRVCIGRELAMLELIVAIAMTVANFRLSPLPNAPEPRPRAYVTLRSEPPQMVRVEALS